MTEPFVVFVPGQPVAQGSKNGYAIATGRGPNRVYTGRVRMFEHAKALPAWRDDIIAACVSQTHGQILYPQGIPVTCTLEFVMARPKSMPKSKTRPHCTRPDIDKLERAVFDALTFAKVWHDDGQANSGYRSKRYAQLGEEHGVHIRLTTQGLIP